MEGVGRIRLPTLQLVGYVTYLKIFSCFVIIMLHIYVYVSVKGVSFLQDTFRGRVCQCPIVQGVKFLGDGYTHCEGKKSAHMYVMINLMIFFTCLNFYIAASGALRCGINNGGCWKHTQMGRTYSACRVICHTSKLTNFHPLFKHSLPFYIFD